MCRITNRRVANPLVNEVRGWIGKVGIKETQFFPKIELELANFSHDSGSISLSSLPKMPSGIIGPADTAARFVEILTAASDIKIGSKMAQRIYELRKVEHRPKVLGRIRPAVENDQELLESWGVRFAIDCGLKYDHVKLREYTNTAIKHKTRFLWEIDSEPVSMVGVGGNTPNGIRINWVYTPPELRGKGYASAIVAEVSQLQLDLGKKLCFLYTDLANPTSNSIYQRIGYRPVGDSAHYGFE